MGAIGVRCHAVGSGTLPYCAMQPGITEIEAGGAIFSDVLYRERFHLDFPPALHLLASVTEYILEGLHVQNRLNKNAKGGENVFKR